MLQRKFRIGYNRAARIMDQLEEKVWLHQLTDQTNAGYLSEGVSLSYDQRNMPIWKTERRQ